MKSNNNKYQLETYVTFGLVFGIHLLIFIYSTWNC
jgi:hypothetical protein